MSICKVVAILLVLAGISTFGANANAEENDEKLDQTIEKLREYRPYATKFFLGGDSIPPYGVVVHSRVIADAMKSAYTPADIEHLMKATAAARKIDIVEKPWGSFIQAASFEEDDMGDETHYDAIWVRDSVWAYLALAGDAETRADAKKVLLTLLDYMATPAQLERMRAAVANPGLVDGNPGDMNAVHIRFDSQSESFDDVMEGGKPQQWKHKQNDALGLLIEAAVDAYRDGLVVLSELEAKNRMVGIAGLIAYLNAVDFHEMEDSGAWEEIARRNTSSIALVTSAVANLFDLANSEDGREFAAAFAKASQEFGSPATANPFALAHMMLNGYDTIRTQLALGGESPDYESEEDEHYRTADAALLNLIYPAKLDRLTADNKLSALDIVFTLAGDFGIARYGRDDYQSANFWFKGIKTDTDDESYDQRRRNFIPGTEAEWFFDSWFATSALLLYEETEEPGLLAVAARHLNRALGQITDKGMLLADGKPAPAMALPESYNFLVKDGELFTAASPICPLNWAKASLTIALRTYRRVLSE